MVIAFLSGVFMPGRYLLTGSERAILPRSARIITLVAVPIGFGEGGQVVNRIDADGGGVGVVGKMAIGFGEDDALGCPCDDDDAGCQMQFDGRGDGAIDSDDGVGIK